MNLGCANDIKEGWINTDSVYRPEFHDIVEIWDARHSRHWNYDDFDFVLVNHVLCTMREEDVHAVLKNCYDMLRTGGTLQVIDMDLNKVFEAYQRGDSDAIPIKEGDIDSKLCFAISGYGTRPSLFTQKRMQDLLMNTGFAKTRSLLESEYDTRPDESFVIEATK